MTHGKVSSYQRGCRCDLCRAAQSTYYRAWYAKRKAAGVTRSPKKPRVELVPDAPVDVVAPHVPRSAPLAPMRRRKSPPTSILPETVGCTLEEVVPEGAPRRLVILGQTFELVRCEPLESDIVEKTCARRWAIANGKVRGAGADAIARAKLDACEGCEVGEARARKE